MRQADDDWRIRRRKQLAAHIRQFVGTNVTDQNVRLLAGDVVFQIGPANLSDELHVGLLVCDLGEDVAQHGRLHFAQRDSDPAHKVDLRRIGATYAADARGTNGAIVSKIC